MTRAPASPRKTRSTPSPSRRLSSPSRQTTLSSSATSSPSGMKQQQTPSSAASLGRRQSAISPTPRYSSSSSPQQRNSPQPQQDEVEQQRSSNSFSPLAGNSSSRQRTLSSSSGRHSSPRKRLAAAQAQLQQQQQQHHLHKPIPSKLPSSPSSRLSTPSKKTNSSSRGQHRNSSSGSKQQQSSSTKNKMQSSSTPPPPSGTGGGGGADTVTFVTAQSSAEADCLDTSMQMLRRTMKDNAKAYEYLFDSTTATKGSCILGGGGGEANHSAAGTAPDANNDNNNGNSNSWVNILHTLREQHEEEKSQWKKDLREAKEKTRHFKHELRDNLTERLHWLEAKVRHQATSGPASGILGSCSGGGVGSNHAQQQQSSEQQQQDQHTADNLTQPSDEEDGPNSTLGMTNSSSTSTMTQSCSASMEDTAGSTTINTGTVGGGDGTIVDENTVGKGGVLRSEKEEGSIEVIFNTLSQEAVKKRIHELEGDLQATIHNHVSAQKEWARSLDEAAAVTANSTALSAHMQELLQDVATDLRKTYQGELQEADKKSQALKRDLRLALEKYHEDKAVWQQETARLKDDSRRLLAERKGMDTQLSQKQQEIVAVEGNVEDLKRQVDLAHRQRTIAQKQVARLQERLSEQQRMMEASSSSTTGGGGTRRQADPPSPIRPGDWQDKYRRAIQERDALQLEAEETVKMLGDYQKQIEKERTDFENRQKASEKKWQAETKRQIKEFREAQIAKYAKKPLSEVPQAEMERRYRDSVEKRNEMAARMRKVELQHAADKGSWKLQLESALAESRKISTEKEKLETALAQTKKDHEAETQIWHNRVKEMTTEWHQKVHELKTKHRKECNKLREEISEIQVAKTGTEAAVTQNRHMLEEIKNQHRAELMDWKERSVEHNKNIMAEVEEKHKKQVAKLEKVIEDYEKQLTEMETTHADEISEWAEEIRSAVIEHEKRMSELKEEHQASADEWNTLTLQLEKDKEQEQQENEKQSEEIKGLIQKTEQLQATIEELNRSHQHELSLLEDKVKKAEASAVEQLDSLRARHDEKIKHLEQTHQNTIIRLQEKHEGKTRELEQANEQTIIRLQEKHEEQLSAKDASHEARVTALHQEHEQKSTQLEMTLKEKVSSYESIVTEWRDNHDTLKKAKERLEKDKSKSVAELSEQAAILEKEKKKLETDIQRIQSERDDVELELRDRADLFLEEKNRLETLLDEKSNRDGELNAKVEKLESKIKEMKKSHKETLLEWNTVATKLEEDKAAAEKEKNEKEEQLAEWKSKAEKLEAAIGMNQNGLMEVSALHAGEIQDLQDKMQTLRLENERQIELARQACDEEIQQWKGRLETTQSEYKSKIAVFKGEHNREAKRWRNELDAAEEKTRVLAEQTNILSGTLEELHDAHSNDSKRWEADLAKSKAENERLRAEKERVQAEKERVQAELSRLKEDKEKLGINFSNKTGEVDRRQDDHAKLQAKKERLEEEVSRLTIQVEKLEHSESKLVAAKESQAVDKSWTELASGLEERQTSMTNAVEELRKDVVSVRETLMTSAKTEELVQDAHFGDIRDSLEEIQNGLNDAVAELTLETEAMIENREYLKTLAESSFNGGEVQSKCFEQQERLLADMGTLSENLKIVMGMDNGDVSAVRDKLRADLADELHRKEVALAAINAEIETVREQLANERGLRERAEQEILTLNDQADAYGEELMRLQGVNKGLEDTLKKAEIRMQSALGVGGDAENEEHGPGDGDINKSPTDDSSSPMLEEALLLAQNVKDLVDGNGGHDKETSVMEMLETLSDMMDHHDRGGAVSSGGGKSEPTRSGADIPIEVEISSTPQGRSVECVSSKRGMGFLFDDSAPERLIKLAEVQVGHDAINDDPPSPVMSPPGKENHGDTSSSSNHQIKTHSKLDLVVDQLYGRCQLLERERTELMEVTLDLLQSAREANAAELDAALSTARRRSAEELLKVREQNQEGMWRLYHKLCGNCQHGLLKSSNTGDDCSPCASLQPSHATNLSPHNNTPRSSSHQTSV